ncbi:site-specific integrase [Pseudomonas veronii]|uniref:Site-specific integrase n=1 Tax=Pseudomonas veronii TaxID=76761 RepID=A0ABS0V8J7_PSEVE|nr:site-specific integrase [Pseudomonas veronii]MBI6553679.1 site-specific integrase [Pseudomonas veronii]MBI6647815.1 site-specific integrase [Pseudomonas veronii]
MGHQIVEIRINGARRKVLVQEHMPVYYPNLYVTLEQSGRALNTQQKYLEHIGVIEDYLKHESIDLIARLEERPTSRYLTDSEISRFVADAALCKSTLDKKYRGIRLLPAAYKTVGKVHAQQRLETVRDYLKFLYDKMGEETTRDSALDEVERRINRKIKAARPSWKKVRNEDMKGLTNQERGRLLEIMHPESVENPFANEALKLRNYIILLLGIDMGLRRSEMLLIKIDDIRWHNRELYVVNIESEETDPRTLAPQFKTHERVLEMGDDLLFALKTYVDTYRVFKGGKAEAKTHPFLLVSHRRNYGGPLSVKAIDGILPRVGKVAPELSHIHPHVLRHDAVFTLLESMREDLEKLTPEDRTTKAQKILTYAFGWSPESNMPSLYGAKFWKEEANKAIKKRSDKFKAIRASVEAEVRRGHAE